MKESFGGSHNRCSNSAITYPSMCCCRMHSTSVCIRYFSEPLYCTGWNRQLIVKVDLTGRTARPFSNNHKREKTIVNLNSLRAVCVVCIAKGWPREEESTSFFYAQRDAFVQRIIWTVKKLNNMKTTYTVMYASYLTTVQRMVTYTISESACIQNT
jgi:hypothetical protein